MSSSSSSNVAPAAATSTAPSRFSDKLRAVDRLSPANVKHNQELVFFIRTFVSILGGCCCGILGLTNWNGFAFYLLTAVATSLVMIGKVGSLNVKSYFISLNALTIDGFIGSLLSYVLFWTLLYDIVYVY